MLVDCGAYVEGKRTTDAALTLDDVRHWAARDDALVWMGLRMPSDDELADVFDAFGIREVGVEEILAPHARPVLTVDEDLTTLVLRTARYDDVEERVSLGELSVLLGPNFVLTVRYGQASPLSGLRERLEKEPDRLELGPQGVMAAIVDQVIDDYLPALDGFERDVLELEASVFDDSLTQPVQRIYRLQRQVRELYVAIDALHDPLARLIRTTRRRWDVEIEAELHEAVEQLSRTVSRTRTLAELLNAALDATLTQVSLRQNADMRKISAWVAIAAVPTMVAGLYGMNFEQMPELGWRFGYPLVLLAIAVVCGLLYRNFRRSGWL